MPGPISDSYDPEFGTGENVARVREAVTEVRDRLTDILGPDLHYIFDVIEGSKGIPRTLIWSERELRIIRFALNRELETL